MCCRGIGAGPKVRTAAMSKGKNAPVAQSSMDFAAVAGRLLEKTSVHHISHGEITRSFKNLKPWKKVRTGPDIQEMHCTYAFQLPKANS